MTRYVVEEIGGEFVLPLAGFVCAEVRSDNELVLTSEDAAAEVWVTGSKFGEEAVRQLVADRARVEKAVATRDGTLRLDFDGGAQLVNPSAADFEAWEVRGPGYVLAVAVPGGGEPALWDETSKIQVIRAGDPLPRTLLEMFQAYGLAPAGEFELRCAKGQREAFELHAPDAPPLNRSEIVRLMAPQKRKRWFR